MLQIDKDTTRALRIVRNADLVIKLIKQYYERKSKKN